MYNYEWTLFLLYFGKQSTDYTKEECFQLIIVGNIPILGPNYCKICESEGKRGSLQR